MEKPSSDDATPNEDRARSAADRSAVPEGDGAPLEWDSLVPLLVHPTKVAILEAMRWTGEPLSASQLVEMVDDRKTGLSHVSYHMVFLARLGIVELVRRQPVRGASEGFYFFPRRTINQITREERDALYEQVVTRLTGMDDVRVAAERGDFDAADRLAREYRDYLTVLVNDLGWGTVQQRERIMLVTPREVLRRFFRRILDSAGESRAAQSEQRDEERRLAKADDLLERTSQRLLRRLGTS